MTRLPVDRFASYVATLGRGPGRSRALNREEAADAMHILLAGEADPMQIGAFLMLLRYRGEDAEEIAGLAEAAHAACKIDDANVDLDWPSYGAGRTRAEPWFLLSALALAAAGYRVLMHGTNEFSASTTVADALKALGLRHASTSDDAKVLLDAAGFAYLPAEILCPPLAALLGLRRLLGLRSPMNTVARLLDPASARAGVDGVFHPPYIETHLAAAERLGRPRLLVLKGGGGEAERNPAKPTTAHLWDGTSGRSEIALPALAVAAEGAEAQSMGAIWLNGMRHEAIEARVVGTIALALMAMGKGGDSEAASIWRERPRVRQPA